MEGVTWTSKQGRAGGTLGAARELASVRVVGSTIDLGELWARLRTHEWVVASADATEEAASLTLRLLLPYGPDASFERSLTILRRVLLGETQKSVASSFAIAPSTVALHCSRGLTRIGAATLTSRTPLMVVMAAHASAGFRFPLAHVEPLGDDVLRIAVRLANAFTTPRLSGVERAILRELACGLDNAALARCRGTSRRTIANQLGSLFRKFGVSGRGELLAKISRSIAQRAPEPGIASSAAHIPHGHP